MDLFLLLFENFVGFFAGKTGCGNWLIVVGIVIVCWLGWHGMEWDGSGCFKARSIHCSDI